MSAKITISHTRSREVSSSGSIENTDEGATSSPVELPSSSPTTASQEEFESEDEEVWDPDDIEPSESASRSDSASRPASRPPPTAKARTYANTGPAETGRRESPRQRLPPAPEPDQRRISRRDAREPREYREPHRSQHRQHRRRDVSSHSDSVGSHEYYGHGRNQHYGHGPPNHHPSQQWEFVQPQQPQHHYPPYPASNIGSQGAAYNPFTGNPLQPPGQQLVHYQQQHHSGYFPPNPLMPTYSHPPMSPTAPPHPAAFYDHHRVPTPQMPVMPMQFYPSYPMHPMHPMPAPAPAVSPSSGTSADEEKFSKLEKMILAQEEVRMARENKREAEMEYARQVAEAEAAKKREEAEQAVKVADAEKQAKAAAEAEADSKAKEAEAKHKKALEELQKKAEAAQTAEKNAKKAEEEAKKEAEALKPADAPIKFKDAVGRTFSFPWQLCKTWKGIETLIKQAFLHVEIIGHHVQEGHYDLVGPNGEIILPQVWESTVQPDWTVTMHMWPMAEEKKEEPKPPPAAQPPLPNRPRSRSTDRVGLFGRRKSKKKSAVVMVPKSGNADLTVPPPPPPAHGSESASDMVTVVRDKRSKSREPVPPLLAWSAASMGSKRKTKK